MKVKVEVREATLIGDDKPTLDEVVLLVDGKCLFHLEQLSDTDWFLGIGDPDGQYVRVILGTKRASVKAFWDNEGPKDALHKVDGVEFPQEVEP